MMMRTIIVTIVTASTIAFGWYATVNLREAMNRSRQKETMAVMHTWASAFEQHRATPAPRDGWGRPLHVVGDHDSYTITSFGRDGLRDRKVVAGAANGVDCDIIYANGSFIQWPDTGL